MKNQVDALRKTVAFCGEIECPPACKDRLAQESFEAFARENGAVVRFYCRTRRCMVTASEQREVTP